MTKLSSVWNDCPICGHYMVLSERSNDQVSILVCPATYDNLSPNDWHYRLVSHKNNISWDIIKFEPNLIFKRYKNKTECIKFSDDKYDQSLNKVISFNTVIPLSKINTVDKMKKLLLFS